MNACCRILLLVTTHQTFHISPLLLWLYSIERPRTRGFCSKVSSASCSASTHPWSLMWECVVYALPRADSLSKSQSPFYQRSIRIRTCLLQKLHMAGQCAVCLLALEKISTLERQHTCPARSATLGRTESIRSHVVLFFSPCRQSLLSRPPDPLHAWLAEYKHTLSIRTICYITLSRRTPKTISGDSMSVSKIKTPPYMCTKQGTTRNMTALLLPFRVSY